MKKNQAEERIAKRFTRRALLLTCIQGAAAAGLAARMYQLQVIEGEEYFRLSDENRIRPRLIAPVRGELFDRNGAPLAVNRQNYRVVMISEQTDDVELTLDRLSKIIPLPRARREKLIKEIKSAPSFAPVTISENLSWDEFAKINANAPSMPGVSPDLGWTRHYPEAYYAAHAIGYVAAFSDADKSRPDAQDKVLTQPGVRIGKSGVERMREAQLRGRAGLRRVEVNARGREIRDLHRSEGETGADMTLTLDLQLQKYALERFGEESGAAVVMDIYSGDVLALTSAPSFDPNNFVLGWSGRDWGRVNTNPRRPLSNKAVTGRYPPGSTFKMIVLLAALEAGVINRNFSVHCGGKIKLGNREFHCWKRGGHGRMGVTNSLKHSCDIFYYEAAKRVGIDRLAAFAAKFGVGERPQIDLPNVDDGLMPTKAWKVATRNENWQMGETLNAGIGQGFVLMTPLQLAIMTARLANGGLGVNPRLIKSVQGVDELLAPLRALGVKEDYMKLAMRGMKAVSNEQGGTAFGARIAAAGYELAGKTGTSQVRRISAAERARRVRKNEELPWELRDHALFVAFAPLDAPRYAISVVVEHGGSGSRAAAPIARDIMLRALFRGEPPDYALPDQAAIMRAVHQRPA